VNTAAIEVERLGREAVGPLLDQLSAVYAESYDEPPYEFGAEEFALFRDRFEGQRAHSGFSLVTARSEGRLVGFIFGFTLPPASGWWSGLLSPLPPDFTAEHPGRTLAIIEMAVRRPWRRQRVATEMHDMLLADRTEERATLAAHPEAEAAQAAYAKWGYRRVTRARNQLPGDPIYDLLFKPLK
jgi:RimJ/RimL family protein N-acetyltransferase